MERMPAAHRNKLWGGEAGILGFPPSDRTLGQSFVQRCPATPKGTADVAWSTCLARHVHPTMLLGLVLPACLVAAQSSPTSSPIVEHALASLDRGLAAAHADDTHLRHLSDLPTKPGSAADGDRARALTNSGRGRGGMGGRGGRGQAKTGASKAGASKD
eukprot:scaffold41302_cov60-Phaeocystis_antarctica.AAC.1